MTEADLAKLQDLSNAWIRVYISENERRLAEMDRERKRSLALQIRRMQRRNQTAVAAGR